MATITPFSSEESDLIDKLITDLTDALRVTAYTDITPREIWKRQSHLRRTYEKQLPHFISEVGTTRVIPAYTEFQELLNDTHSRKEIRTRAEEILLDYLTTEQEDY